MFCRLCLESLQLVRKLLKQGVHFKRRSFISLFSWTRRLSFRKNIFEHLVQLKGFSPEWIWEYLWECLFKLLCREGVRKSENFTTFQLARKLQNFINSGPGLLSFSPKVENGKVSSLLKNVLKIFFQYYTNWNICKRGKISGTSDNFPLFQLSRKSRYYK